MHPFRTHNCGALTEKLVGETVRVSGWIHRKRDHGNLLFVDLRDQFGITQCVVETDEPTFAAMDSARPESVVTVTGAVVARSPATINPALPTGQVEVRIAELEIQGPADELPIQVFGDQEFPEDLRLRYRFLDLRREKMHRNIVLRSNVITSIRRRMVERGFTELQTPILTASSPEGARDYLVPSRLHPGQFYALPQAPQQFKQLYMISGFDRYFQIAPCFRDEDARADRSPGEFYQLDVEMSFVEQEDVFAAIEPVIAGVFEEFTGTDVARPFPRIPFAEAMLKYGSDKPDLRNPIEIADVTEAFRASGFGIFAKAIENGAVVRAIPASGAASRARSFFDKMNDLARAGGWPGLGYIQFPKDGGAKGPIAKNLDADRVAMILENAGLNPGDGVFFACDQPDKAAELAGLARTKVGADLELAEVGDFRFCWIVNYPMYEFDAAAGKIEFSHNPFSMPQGGLQALNEKDPLDVLAYQYDIVCNGVELSSGAIRNHRPDTMIRAFEIAGYSEADVKEQFGGMFNAFRFGAPPHGGIAPGIDRIVMLIAGEPNLREIVAFPMTQNARDLMMGAPAHVPDQALKDIHIKVVMPPKKVDPDPAT